MTWQTASEKLLQDETSNISKNPRYGGHQQGIASLVYNFFQKKYSDGAV